MSYQPKVYREQGGDRQVIASGGSLDVESGGELDIESGGALKLAGSAVTATAAELNLLDGLTALEDGATANPEQSAIVSLTDNSGGTANSTVEACGTAVTGVDGTGSNAASKADVDARLVSIANNCADLAAKINAILTALRAANLIEE